MMHVARRVEKRLLFSKIVKIQTSMFLRGQIKFRRTCTIFFSPFYLMLNIRENSRNPYVRLTLEFDKMIKKEENRTKFQGFVVKRRFQSSKREKFLSVTTHV